MGAMVGVSSLGCIFLIRVGGGMLTKYARSAECGTVTFPDLPEVALQHKARVSRSCKCSCFVSATCTPSWNVRRVGQPRLEWADAPLQYCFILILASDCEGGAVQAQTQVSMFCIALQCCLK